MCRPSVRRLIPGSVSRPGAPIIARNDYSETGNEDNIIVISLIRSKTLGFLTSTRRANVMLTRCQPGVYIVSSKAFLEGKGADSLVGKMAAELGKQPGAPRWKV